MTTKPRFAEDANFVNGLAAVALFLVLGAVFVTTSFGEPAGFPAEASITASLGYALFNIGSDAVPSVIASESFLAAFEIVDVVLVAALVASITLARRETGGTVVSALTDGGRVDETDEDGGEP